MTQEEIKKPVAPKEPAYADYMQEYENMPAFDYNGFQEQWRSGSKPLLDALMSNYVKPERQITPEQAKKAKFASAMTDSLTSLAELFAHGQGAYVRPRQGKSNQQMTNDRLRQMQDKYEQDMIRYGNMMANAEMQDWQQMLRAQLEDRNDRKNLLMHKIGQAQQLEKEKRNRDYQIKDEERAIENYIKKATWEYNNITKPTMAERDRYDSRSVARRMLGGGGTKEETPVMFINAHPNDPNGRRDALGQNVIPLNLTKEQVASYASMAKEDKDFLKLYPDAEAITTDYMGNKRKGLMSDAHLSWAYAQYLYDKQFAGQGNKPSNLPTSEELGFYNIPQLPKWQQSKSSGNARGGIKGNGR